MLTTLTAWIAILQGIVTIAALTVGTIIAWLGLSTWKAQMNAKVDYDLARRVLIAVYTVRDAISSARLNSNVEAIDNSANTKEAHNQRINAALEPVSALEVELLETEAIWGNDINMLCREVIQLYLELHFAFLAFYYVQNLDPNEKEKYYRILFSEFDANIQDEFADRLKKRVKDVETKLKLKLKLNRENLRGNK